MITNVLDNIMKKDVLSVIGMIGVIAVVNYITKQYIETKSNTKCESPNENTLLYKKQQELLELLQQITQLKKELVSKDANDITFTST